MTATQKELLVQKVDKALDGLRPHLEVDGGNIEIVELTDDLVLKIKWLGNCEMCTMSTMTLKAGVEQAVKQHVPEITAVEPVNGIG
jgi:Fe-S cluster biogenesis protein NfuA